MGTYHNTHFRKIELRGTNGKDEVHAAVTSEIVYGKQRPGEHNRLAQTLQRKAERAGRVTHGIAPMDDHKTIEVVVELRDCLCNIYPMFWSDIGRTNIGDRKKLQGYFLLKFREKTVDLIQRFNGLYATGLLIDLHTDGPADIEKRNPWSCHI